MIRHRIITTGVAALAAAAIVTTSGCAASAPADDGVTEMRWGIVGTDFGGVDPLTFTSGNMLLANIFDTLLTSAPDGSIAPGLAEVDSSDPMRYVFTLRDGLTFWNGNPVTAEDVVFSLDYERLPPSAYESLFLNIDTVTAQDDKTVVIEMVRPDAGILSTLSSVGAGIFEKKFFEENEENFGKPGTLVMGSGPYEITSLDATKGAEFVANPDWYGGEPDIDKLVVKPFQSLANAALAFRTGEVDAVFPISDPKGFESNSGTELLAVTGCKQTLMSMNTQVPPFDDVHVRRAVERAIDREALAASVGVGAVTYSSFLPDAVMASVADEDQIAELNASMPDSSFDLDAAAEELAQSAYPDGVSATWQVFDDGARPTIAQAISGMLAEANIDIKVEVVSEEVSNQLVGEPDPAKKPALHLMRQDCSMEPSSTTGYLLDSANAAVGYANYAAYVNPVVDQLLVDSLASNESADRFAAYSEMMKVVATDVPYIPLYLDENVVALSDKFDWPNFNAFSSTYGSASWVAEVKVK